MYRRLRLQAQRREPMGHRMGKRKYYRRLRLQAQRREPIGHRMGCTRSELVNCANGPLLQHENFLNIRGVSPEQDAIRHQTMETAKINQSGSFDVR
ncbi:hypothetical protein EVAR_54119_1 [Eumeta japonica]|uniref:Uncharacterized protein n=1 Tax=Eumeta variegata TaxID=151549 RepID=A0A4C1YW38_EUMVA|nr:hypothetical protein EVAR_54119_1 [Eumeta japonica]